MMGPGAEPHARLRRGPAPTGADKLRRFAWLLVESTIYCWSPAPLMGWRRVVLRAFGAKVGAGAHPYPSARIWAPWNLEMAARSCLGPRTICYSVGKIRLGVDSIVSQGAHLCGATHDHRDPAFPLVIGDIEIGSAAWVAADAFIGPGVTIADRAVVGARAVVVKGVAKGDVVAGNPARVVGTR
jgi:putative colanic acid biosynthesis acetyltransferase WcaF